VRAVIYCRVSTGEQENENQTRVLESWAHANELTLVGTYQESETAWRAGHQKELNQLGRDAYRRKFDVVLVWALDRLSRQGPQSILSLIHTLKAYGVSVYSYQEPWTLAPGEVADLLYAITGWVARMESNRRSERTKAGLERLKAQGRKLGRPPGARDTKQRKRRPMESNRRGGLLFPGADDSIS